MQTDTPIYRMISDVRAKEMTRGDYNAYRGWTVPENENPADDGYLIEHIGSSMPKNDPRHDGHISWVPKAVFEVAYRLVVA